MPVTGQANDAVCDTPPAGIRGCCGRRVNCSRRLEEPGDVGQLELQAPLAVRGRGRNSMDQAAAAADSEGSDIEAASIASSMSTTASAGTTTTTAALPDPLSPGLVQMMAHKIMNSFVPLLHILFFLKLIMISKSSILCNLSKYSSLSLSLFVISLLLIVVKRLDDLLFIRFLSFLARSRSKMVGRLILCFSMYLMIIVSVLVSYRSFVPEKSVGVDYIEIRQG